ncbi:MAG: hypothetical protein IKP21_00715 [Bacteroidales bacterium]|nr:hypothetical protein [Bacteroidales bacterium]
MGLDSCHLCPRACGADRTKAAGFCHASDSLEVASVCLHRGEEPPLNPIVNIFFAHCNLQCIYCQNHQISTAERAKWEPISVDTLADQIAENIKKSNSLTIKQSGNPLVGFVTAAHYAHHIPEIVHAIRHKGFNPTFVYNSSGYESVNTLRSLEGLIDIYLPDYKYADSQLAAAYSHAPDYPEVAYDAIREMIRQVGSGLKVDESGTAYRGLIVRHLVLPGHTENSVQVLDRLADLTSPLPPFSLHLSLMAQYYPPRTDLPSPLDRKLTHDEYSTVVDHAQDLGLIAGWIQELDASDNYRPNFENADSPFQNL